MHKQKHNHNHGFCQVGFQKQVIFLGSLVHNNKKSLTNGKQIKQN